MNDTAIRHRTPGISGYNRFGCRCEECRAAASEANRRYRLKPKPPVHITPGITGYQRGCRCPECLAGKAIYRKKPGPAARAHAERYDFANAKTAEAREAKRLYDQARHKRIYRPSEARRDRLWRVYKITPEQYQEMFEAQDGRCAICFNEPGAMGFLAIDHDHACCPGERTCGKCIRGLLCWPCNSFLGRVGDSADALVAYLGRRAVQV